MYNLSDRNASPHTFVLRFLQAVQAVCTLFRLVALEVAVGEGGVWSLLGSSGESELALDSSFGGIIRTQSI